MQDPRLDRMAEVLVRYSLALREGETCRIAGEVATLPLMLAAYRQAVRAGALPYLDIRSEDAGEILLTEGTDEQIRHVNDFERAEIERIDTYLSFFGGTNTRHLAGVDPAKNGLRRKAMQPLFETMLQRTASGDLRWCGAQYPGAASAQDANMSTAQFEDFVFRACRLDQPDPVAAWEAVSAAQAKLVAFLQQGERIRVIGPDTDLSFTFGNRPWVNCDGKMNFPDGEVFTCPIEDSTEGTIRYTFPAVHGGNEVEDVRLTFRKGRVVEASAARGQDFLMAMLDTDEGARTPGEFAIGTNYGIQQFMRNTLFDEKIGGTVHLAVGASLPDAQGTNESAIHWDMVCDLREGGEIQLDGETFFRDGRFLHDWGIGAPAAAEAAAAS